MGNAVYRKDGSNNIRIRNLRHKTSVSSEVRDHSAYMLEKIPISGWIKMSEKITSPYKIPTISSLIEHNGKIYASGTDNTNEKGPLLEWNGTNAWSIVCDTIDSAEYYIKQIVSFSGFIFGLGVQGSLYKWDGISPTWERVAYPYYQSNGGCLCVYNNELYEATEYRGLLLKWNGWEWVEIAPQIENYTSHTAMMVFNGELYALGHTAYSNYNILHKFNGINAWVAETIPTTSKYTFLVEHKHELYAATYGFSEGCFLGKVSNGEWEIIINANPETLKNSTTSLYSDGAHIYAGVTNGKLLKWDGIGDMWEEIAQNYDADAYKIPSLIGYNGYIYAGTSSGVLLKYLDNGYNNISHRINI